MAILPPNDGLITETNQQYYEGAQAFRANSDNDINQEFPTSFNTDLYLGNWNPNEPNYALNNFKIYTSSTGIPGSYSEWLTSFTVVNNVITLAAAPGANAYIVVQLKTLSGGKYGTTDAEKAFGQTVEDNYGGYQYLKLSDAIDNFMVGYVGDGKIIQTAKKSDVLFFAKRSLQEFSYDILKSIKSQELTIPPSLSLALPEDYVNYVSMAWIDEFGVKRRIYPANNLTDSPYYTNIQDSAGVPTQDNFANNIEGTSITEERWKAANDRLINQSQLINMEDWAYWADYYGINGYWNWGQQYGISPQYANVNGWFNFNDREGKISFSSNLANKLIILEYISDGLAYDTDTKVPKLAEEALYASILSYIVSTRANQPEYIVQRLRREKTAKLRNAKIRLSNIKLEEITQVMRGQSKWIKH
jgi:hypothetical protein